MQGLWARGNFLGGLLDSLSSYIGDDELHSEYSSDDESTEALALAPEPNHPLPSIDSDFSDLDTDWDLSDTSSPSPRPTLLKGQTSNSQGETPTSPFKLSDLGSSTEPEDEVVAPSSPSSDRGSSTESEDEGVHGPPPSPDLTDPERHLDHQSLSADSQPVDLLAAIYAVKGKAKKSRRISGTAKDVGNVAQAARVR
jgi:hypothetical protein